MSLATDRQLLKWTSDEEHAIGLRDSIIRFETLVSHMDKEIGRANKMKQLVDLQGKISISRRKRKRLGALRLVTADRFVVREGELGKMCR